MELVSCGFGITSLSGRSVVERKSNPMEPVSCGFGITLWGGSRVVEWKSNPMKQVGSGFGITFCRGRRMVGRKSNPMEQEDVVLGLLYWVEEVLWKKIQCRNGCKRAFYNKKDIIYNSHVRQSMNKKYKLCKLHKNNQKK